MQVSGDDMKPSRVDDYVCGFDQTCQLLRLLTTNAELVAPDSSEGVEGLGPGRNL
jgi:hypothetical protein